MTGEATSGCVLAADIGGTRARFAIGQDGALRDAAEFAVAEFAVADFAGPVAALAAYLDRCGRPALQAAVLAIAAPVGDGEEAALTNGHWRFRRDELARELALPIGRLRLVNDFHALAAALPTLGQDDTRPVGESSGGVAGIAGAAMAVLGPGTGLGVAGLVPGLAGWEVIVGEGGHVTLAPDNARESAILDLARQQFSHVSAERLLSGAGLPLLHELAARVDGRPVILASDCPTPELVAAALAGDADCRNTVDTFCAWLGSVAGNVALGFGARGGVFIGGGIVPRLGPLFDASAFRARFEAKGRLNGYLAAVPTRVILCPTPALRGAARLAEETCRRGAQCSVQ